MARPPTTREQVLGVAGILRRKLPLGKPVKVLVSKRLTYEYGYCQLDRRGYRVVVNLRIADPWSPRGRAVTVGEATETLCHEWAHALAWTSSVSSKDHDAAWGKAYARVYRVVFEQ